MADILGSIPWADFSWPGLIALTVVLIIRGDIVPRRTLDAMTQERDMWRSTALTALQINESALGIGRASAAALDAIPKPAGGEDE